MPPAQAFGSGGALTQAAPKVAGGDDHSLAEVAVETGDQSSIVEVGWIVQPASYGDDDAHLFVFHWADCLPTCYNGCGWHQVSANYFPGMTLKASDMGTDFRIENKNGDFWISYAGEAMGYFPASLWSAPWSIANTQWFGEVSALELASCTQMGTGAFGSADGAAKWSDLYLVDKMFAHVAANAARATVTNAMLYDASGATPTGFAFGGPGACH
jgi:hypothetical protein